VAEPIFHYTGRNRYTADPTIPDNTLAQIAINLTLYHWGKFKFLTVNLLWYWFFFSNNLVNLMPWLPLNVIRDNVNYWIMWSNWSRLTNPKSLYYYVYQSSLFVYCYHLVNSLFLSQSDHIKQFFLY